MLSTVGLALGLYVALVLVVGLVASRRSGSSPEEYFLANRGLGRVVLFMALFGTNATPFVLVGIPAQSYRDGIGIFGLNAPIIALGIPLTFWAIGAPARAMGVRLGACTPAELHSRRLGSRAVGVVLFLLFTAYTIPYMVAAVKGAATTLQVATDGALDPAVAGLGVLVVALIYTALGGMRATAWTNVMQGALFLGFMVTAFVVISSDLGGLAAATAAVREAAPEKLVMQGSPRFEPVPFATYGLVLSLTVIAFPHMYVRLMASDGDGPLRSACRLYPLALAALWVPAVMLGVWALAAFPGLEDADQVFSLMVSGHMPAGLAAVGSVAVMAAVMSTLDAQILVLSSMLVRDVLAPLRRSVASGSSFNASVVQATGGHQATGSVPDAHGAHDVRNGRLFTLVVAAVVWGLSLTWGQSIFDIALLAFQGYVTLVPTLFFTARWRRFNAAGALASLGLATLVFAAGTAGLFAGLPLLGDLPPTLWALVAGAVGGVVGTRVTAPPAPELVRAAFDDPT